MYEKQLELVRRAGSQVTGRAFGPLPVDADIADLGLDSVQVMEMVTWLEEELAIRVPDEELAAIATIGDLCAVLERHRSVTS